jgi:hypothetical protein
MSKYMQSLSLQIVTFLERVHKTKFCNVITISHGCIVIIGGYIPKQLKDVTKEYHKYVAQKEKDKHKKHIRLCYKYIPVKNLTEIDMVNNNGKRASFFFIFLLGLID